MSHRPKDIIGAAAVEALREAGWIVVRHDAIRLAQAMERDNCRHEATATHSKPGR